MNQLRNCRKKVQQFETTLPENEEALLIKEALINNYEDAYIEGENLAVTLEKKVNQLK